MQQSSSFAGRAGALAAGLMALLAGADASASPTVVWTCYHNGAATVLATDNGEDVGTKFVTRKSTGQIKADCAVETRKTDLVLGAPQDDGDGDAFSYAGLVNNFLVLDAGTGPDRGLAIFDLGTGKEVLKEQYSIQDNCGPGTGCTSPDLDIADSGVTFWRETTEPASAKNCPKYAQFMKTTGSAAIEQKSIFKFASLKMESLKAKRCTQRQ